MHLLCILRGGIKSAALLSNLGRPGNWFWPVETSFSRLKPASPEEVGHNAVVMQLSHDLMHTKAISPYKVHIECLRRRSEVMPCLGGGYNVKRASRWPLVADTLAASLLSRRSERKWRKANIAKKFCLDI